ncbi:uncharacterized protein PV09_09183 [Verruconis gallopava]|uniref:Major facilitator superfamily (MFS) profile domain-containing protein n=1 Tax=Verruconis gallopava TaxID=253628 RepID=A0A0D1YEF0_9PEZI|nr:uncharacterized protein PV09_09183 [Verruconis gallopava]KIV99076.1 hypothetical protein PV09_09183 [Verruconis gallopava]
MASIAKGDGGDLEKQNVDISAQQERPQSLELQAVQSHISSHQDMAAIAESPPAGDKYAEAGDDIYDKFSNKRKMVMVAVVSFCGFLAPISSTSVLAAVPEVASTYSTSGSVINVSNALYLVFMGFSPVFWGPLGQVYGRRIVSIDMSAFPSLTKKLTLQLQTSIFASSLFLAFSIGTALAPNLASFFVFRVLTAFQGTSFLIIGASVIGDIYRPVDRATALGWFLSGTLIGPAFGPFISGIIVTFRPWRDLFWLQTALAGVGALLVCFGLPETIHRKRSDELNGLTRKQYARKLWAWTNPLRVIRLFRYPNLLIASLASSALLWNMYSLLTPIRYVLNPRFDLTSPLQSGLFYIAPGCGYLLGTFFGGRWADYTVRKYIKKRGERVAEDRLRSQCADWMDRISDPTPKWVSWRIWIIH